MADPVYQSQLARQQKREDAELDLTKRNTAANETRANASLIKAKIPKKPTLKNRKLKPMVKTRQALDSIETLGKGTSRETAFDFVNNELVKRGYPSETLVEVQPAKAATGQTAPYSRVWDPEAYAAAESIGGEIPFMPTSGDVPLIPSAVNAIDKKVDEVTEGYTTIPEDEKALHEGGLKPQVL
ncbi:unnamed protein product [Sphagnum jensenii]|uniref:Uncharacterized protein n=1 Tax=Sphagnum jensenii TaxID=128206 RepID=A0ABP0VIF2_9BRYO